MALVRATTTFHGPDHLVVLAGEIYESDDPIVVGAPANFEPVALSGRSASIVEAATAAPGEKRNVKRP